jgi:hypothetical protein
MITVHTHEHDPVMNRVSWRHLRWRQGNTAWRRWRWRQAPMPLGR